MVSSCEERLIGAALSNLEWDERGGANLEGRDLCRAAARDFGVSALVICVLALLTLVFISEGGSLGAGIGPPILVLIAIGAAVTLTRAAITFVKGRDVFPELWPATSPPVDEDVRATLSPPASKERELLTALRDSNGGITSVEAAIETSLTVREADRMLSELAGSGHLALESRNGALFYSLPGRDGPGPENR